MQQTNLEFLLVESAVFPSLFVCRLFVRTLAEMTSSVAVCAKLVKRSPCTLETSSERCHRKRHHLP